MDILIFLGLLITGMLWAKRKYPNAEVTKYIDHFFIRNSALVKELPTLLSETKPSKTIVVEAVSGICAQTVNKLKVQVPEDSVLRRHFLAELEREQKSITNPYPTDSVLRRHHLSMLSALVLESDDLNLRDSLDSAPLNPIIPEDSVLRRHFLTELSSKKTINF